MDLDYERNYCCSKMQEEEWYFKVEDYTGELALYEDYSVHYLSYAKYCPWCGKELKANECENKVPSPPEVVKLIDICDR